jgi:N-methylhydantoinase A/oxoprolinase/acetone carboxylase beta subunit
VEHEIAAAFPCALAELRVDALEAALCDLDARCATLMQAEGVSGVEISHFADVCYIGQSYHLEVPLQSHDAGAIYDAFLAAHERVYGHSTQVPAKIVNLRSVHRSRAGKVAVGAVEAAASGAPAMRDIRIRDRVEPVAAAIWSRAALTSDRLVPGPAIIEQSDTTTLIEPGWTARVAGGGALLLERIA